MRTLALTALCFLASAGSAAPALGDKPPRWEYAELTYRNIPGRPGGVTADGAEVAPTPASVLIRWVTGSGEVEMKSWTELADKLKAPGFKKEGSPTLQKIQILNCLGNEGWELMEQQDTRSAAQLNAGPGGRGGFGTAASSSSSWLLKRRLP